MVFTQFEISRLVKKANLFANSLKRSKAVTLSPVSLFDSNKLEVKTKKTFTYCTLEREVRTKVINRFPDFP